MAIQFFCPACRQPIEVDNDVANQTVTCPYCQKVVTAPPQSDPSIALAPTGARSTPAIGEASAPSLVAPYAGSSARPNKLAWASLICVIVCVASWVVLNVVVAKMIGPITHTLTPQEAQKRLSEATSSHPGMTVTLAIGFAGGCLVPVVGVGLAIAALVSRRPPRWPAVVALCILGGLIAIACLNVIGQLAGAQASKG